MKELSFGDEIGLIDWTLSNTQNALEYQNYILASYFKKVKQSINQKLIQGGKPSSLQTNIYNDYLFHYNHIINQLDSQILELNKIKNHLQNTLSTLQNALSVSDLHNEDLQIDMVNAQLQIDLVDKEIEGLQLQLDKLDKILKEK